MVTVGRCQLDIGITIEVAGVYFPVFLAVSSYNNPTKSIPFDSDCIPKDCSASLG
jgi:hypothetical protein